MIQMYTMQHVRPDYGESIDLPAFRGTLDAQYQPVADARLGDDELRLRRIVFKLLAQPGHENAQIWDVFHPPRPPDLAKQRPVSHHAAGVPHEIVEQFELRLREMDVMALLANDAGTPVELDIADQ